MDRFFRVAKSVFVVASVWAIGWSVVGLAIGLIFSFMVALPVFAFSAFLSTLVNSTVTFGVMGFSAGVVFSIALALLEWGAPADELKHSRVALSGAIGGALLPLGFSTWALLNGAPAGVITTMIAFVLFFALLGAGTSLGLLRLLRSPTRIESETPETTRA